MPTAKVISKQAGSSQSRRLLGSALTDHSLPNMTMAGKNIQQYRGCGGLAGQHFVVQTTEPLSGGLNLINGRLELGREDFRPGQHSGPEGRSPRPLAGLGLASRAGGWAGDPLNPRTAGQTTKYTKHRKNERLTKKTLLNALVGTSVVPNVREFGYFGYFVVLTAHLGNAESRGKAGAKRKQKAKSRKQK
jgi:hypothetical protein